MTKSLSRVFAAISLCFLIPAFVLAVEPKPPFRIVGYLPEYRFSRFDAAYATGLTDLILFAAQPTPDGDIDLGKLKDAPWAMLKDFKTRYHVRLILCMGGWGQSDHFAEAVLSDKARAKLVKNAVDLLLSHRLDGLDLDWEHPKNEAESAGYARLLIELKKAFTPHGLTLSVTIAPWQQIPSEGYAAADWVQLMSYDYGQKHSTLEQAKKDIQTFLDRGVPPEKIVLGMPFYGRDVKDRDKSITYQEVQRRHHPPEQVDEVAGYFFNGPVTIRKKTRAALDAHLGGVMVWEIGQDTLSETSLLKAIRAEIEK
ncbi:glycosyl hydrolase family 18 protein [Planctomicrobium piriforme]|uniref:chitinase n=1 Tax=Planctomicrobium piriforme TaxID=1576369 RepID=A0A1I3EZ84_9PLAN|nr:glycoside hydrolase family 18 protein [Planctomicrobium piriforme]SFI04223.1 Chitinase, GH18 family [Planctomicrobium piriforme]